MGISSDTWFSSVTREWYGTSLTPDQYQQKWEEFLTSDAVRSLPANATPEDYHRLYLQFIATQIKSTDPWFAQMTQAAYGNTLSDVEVDQIIRYFLTLPEVLALPATATEADYHRLFLRFIAQLILAQDPWFMKATVQFYGQTTDDELARILLDFLGSPEVIALPSTATEDDYKRLYLQYISSHLKRIYQAEAVTGASPEAVAKSKLMYSIFEILAQMITTTSIAQIKDSEVIAYLTHKREEYIKMLTKVPLYTGTGTVDVDFAASLTKAGYEPYVTITNFLDPNGIKYWNSTLNVCEYHWYPGIVALGAPLKLVLSNITQGLVDQINETGQTVAYYDSPTYSDGTWSGGGYYKKLIIKVTKNPIDPSDPTAPATYLVQRARRDHNDTDESITGWSTVGTVTLTDAPTIVRRTSKPVLVSSADSVYTLITPDSDPNKFALGYGNVTLQSLSESISNAYATSTTNSSSFTLYSGDWADGDNTHKVDPFMPEMLDGSWYRNRLTTSVSTSSDGKPVITVQLVRDSLPFTTEVPNGLGGTTVVDNRKFQGDGTLDWDNSTRLTTTTLQTQTITAADSEQSTITDAINSSFETLWQDATDAHQIGLTDPSQLTSYEQHLNSDFQTYCLQTRDPKIAWKPGILGSAPQEGQNINQYESNTLYSLNAATRAKINQRLQSYLSSISARADVIGNLTDQQQQVVDASITGIKTTNNLIKGIIQQLSQILSAMFK